MITVYGFIIELKEWKTTKVQNQAVPAYQLFTLIIGLLFDVYCCYGYLFSGKFINVCKPRTTLYPFRQPAPPGLAFHGSKVACLPSWLGMMNAGWFRFMQSEILLQMKFIIFQGCFTKQAAFLLGQLAPYNQLLIKPL